MKQLEKMSNYELENLIRNLKQIRVGYQNIEKRYHDLQIKMRKTKDQYRER